MRAILFLFLVAIMATAVQATGILVPQGLQGMVIGTGDAKTITFNIRGDNVSNVDVFYARSDGGVLLNGAGETNTSVTVGQYATVPVQVTLQGASVGNHTVQYGVIVPANGGMMKQELMQQFTVQVVNGVLRWG
jgi:hypothetical protein